MTVLLPRYNKKWKVNGMLHSGSYNWLPLLMALQIIFFSGVHLVVVVYMIIQSIHWLAIFSST